MTRTFRSQSARRAASPFVVGAAIALGATPSAAQNLCSAPPAGADTMLARIVDAVNDGSYPTIKRLVTTAWTDRALAGGPASEIIYTLGAWHWRSRKLEAQLVCAAAPGQVYALLRDTLSEEIDSLAVTVDSATGKIGAYGFRSGVRTFVAPADVVSDSARVAAVRRITRKLAAAGVYAGNVILAKDGRMLYVDSVGEANRERHTPTRFGGQYSIGSMGKLFTATAVLQLVRAGRLSLDDPIGKILPDSIRGPERDNYFRVSAAVRAVPIKYVLSHTSGIEPGKDSLSATPGTRYSYCNFCFFLLGRGLEHLTGTTLMEHFSRAIFAKAGMTHTVNVAAKAPIDSLPPNYMVEFDSIGFHLPRNALIQSVPANGAGNFFSTAQDIFRFGEALRTGTLLPPGDVSLMRAPKKELGAPEYGYGVMRGLAPGVWGHAGGLPGVDADLELFGDSGYVLVTLSNVDGVSGPIRRKAIAVLATKSYFSH
jgi:CubicO group peptidase (beta-lactamase class C family)